MAAARFRACDRSSPAATATTGPRRAISTSRAHVGRLGDPATSKRTSALVFDVLTCWPPGPLDVEKRQVSSGHGMLTPGATLKPAG